jgi:hypothetical protein
MERFSWHQFIDIPPSANGIRGIEIIAVGLA